VTAFRFIHAADIHLDSPLRGLDQYEGAPVEALRDATRRALENLVELAIDREAAFVLIAGDLYDGQWRDHNTGLFFTRQMARLAEKGIGVYLIQGNHDAESKITKRLHWPSNVTPFSTKTPESHEAPGLDVVIHGQGFATQAVTEDLAANYPPPVPGAFNIGLLHTSVDGREGHDSYAPTTLARLRDQGYDYWALGHIHQRECLHEAGPAIHFPGNIQGRHIRETGAKGCLVVEVGEDRSVDAEFVPLDVVRWARVEADCSEAETLDDCLEAVGDALEAARVDAEGRLLAARVVLTGASRAHAALARDPRQTREEIRARAIETGGEGVWLEKVKVETRPPAGPPPDIEGPLAEIAAVAREWLESDEALATLTDSIDAMLAKLPPDLRPAAHELLEDPESRTALIDSAHALVLARLGGGEESA